MRRVEGGSSARPRWLKMALLLLPLVLYPLFVDSGYLMQVGIDTLIFVLLALGLNVAVGWVGLLDLGYIAFFGIGAYFYAALASEYAGRDWGAQWALPVVVAGTAVMGFLLGLPSRRLVGDYLAIVTLFFLQLFLVVVLNARFTSLSAARTASPTSSPCPSSAGGHERWTGPFTFSSSRSLSYSALCTSSTSRGPDVRGGRCAKTSSRQNR